MPDSDSTQTFNDPRVALNRIYTRTGDAGMTMLTGGQKVSKDALRIEAYGTVDELGAFMGMARVSCDESMERAPRLSELAAIIERVQHELFNLGAILSTLPADVHPQQAQIRAADIEQLEREIDAANEELEPLRSFVLPGGTRLNTELHAARTVCRRAERVLVSASKTEEVPAETIQYLNRLSDALFVWSRWANHLMAAPEILWSPNKAASGRNQTK